MFVVDTNILLYAADRSSAAHLPCRGLLERWRTQATAWYLTWGICYEFLRVSTHPKVFKKPWSVMESWRFIAALLASPSLGILTETDRHGQVVSQTVDEIPLLAGNLLHDAHTAILMREHGIHQVYTRDTDFHRFPFIDVIDPLQKS